MTDPVKAPILPAITGNPQTDALLRYGAAILGGAVVGIAAGWARAHGYKIPDADTLKLYGQAAAGAAIFLYAGWLGLQSVKKSQAAVVDNTVAAALTGQVPAAIMAKATDAQAAAVEASPTASVAPVPPKVV